ncbi:hypothetical protein ACJRO7_012766 [Eucalyptus globulus]|uniref:Uncharacterized protein n=1 Tax=Eucalyptus globulus TaxID=34317 RepID=A0ABD3LKM2_EUCGL
MDGSRFDGVTCPFAIACSRPFPSPLPLLLLPPPPSDFKHQIRLPLRRPRHYYYYKFQTRLSIPAESPSARIISPTAAGSPEIFRRREFLSPIRELEKQRV